MPVLLSDHLGVSAGMLDALGVFNSFIDLDSLLHVDPHLLTDSDTPEMQEAREAVTKYFEDIVTLLASAEAKEGPLWQEAKKRLELKELKGVSLGYSQNDADGSAVGPTLAAALADRAFYIIKAGERNPRIFELVGLFTDDYGPDRISDVVLGIAQQSFAKYTERISAALGVPTKEVEIRKEKFQLPLFEHKGKGVPLLFVPKDVLRDLPVALSYGEIIEVAQYNAGIRSKINELFASAADGKKPGKGEIWERVKHDSDLVKALVIAYLKVHGLPYDFREDHAAEYGRFLHARDVAAQIPLVIEKPEGGWTPETAKGAVLEIANTSSYL